MDYGNVEKLFYSFCCDWNKLRFDMFVCDHSDSRGIDLQCYIKLDYFSMYVCCLLKNANLTESDLVPFKVAMELLFTHCS